MILARSSDAVDVYYIGSPLDAGVWKASIQLSPGNCSAPNSIIIKDVKVEKAGKINLVSDTVYYF